MIGGDLIILNDREPVPDGSITFGQLIAEARQEKAAERELDKRTKRHVQLHARYCRRYRVTPSLVVWELYVCRIGNEHFAWFETLLPGARMDLCDYTRAARRDERFGWKK